MKKVFRWGLLCLTILATVVTFANNQEDVRTPEVAVSPSEAVVTPYTEFMMTILYKYTRGIIIIPSNSGAEVFGVGFNNAYISDVRSFHYYSVINEPNTSVRYEVIASNYSHTARTFAYYTSNSIEL